jgi:hypothetical protein
MENKGIDVLIYESVCVDSYSAGNPVKVDMSTYIKHSLRGIV